MVPVTKTFFPPLNKYTDHLKRIWKNEWLTNRGELVIELETKLKSYLNVPNVTLTTNGTLPLQIALKILANGGEVITTPFSYVATTSAIVWENCTPVFVDIHPEYLTIDETKIEAAITSKTTAILATHVFGNPCNVDMIEKIALKYNLKVIYDAAHCFGVRYQDKSLFNYGDVSTCSFHATKIFHTAEGGSFFSNSDDLNKKLYYSHNFGHNGPENFHGVGINAKMSEVQAAMGLSVLPYMAKIFSDRKSVVDFYNENLDNAKIRKMKIRHNTEWNYSYYPIIFNSEEALLKVQESLNEAKIFPRRYFYPSLNTLTYIDQKIMPVSEEISSRILCLPLFHDLDVINQNKIIKIIKHNL
ncbi:DegT/DnrJ/EryC1/StrS family aminotransferase [Christiangramia echinicola]|uniref:dTDP-4-amino-4,6-dideoxygalactose transaminase n=1 Tax=Christiangramia echinicola TaxID=279359 RepID=A0A1H1QNU4_9FLAO|nr:DegT/DnrJ/EryC1/StrS family aminotransferase [Christiangramia echinicola]SDS25140.1 dTDP-4-amino-4,6-dideoxygalactose transaminase [Christiangramia echinicola]